MSDQLKTDRGVATAWPFVFPIMAETLQAQFETLLQQETELLDETRETLTVWMTHRQEAMEADLRTFQMMWACRDAGSLTATYADWLTNSIRRLFVDMSDASAEAFRLAVIGQRAVLPLFLLCSGATKSTPSKEPSASPAGKDARRMKGTQRAEAAREVREHTSAE